MDSDFLRESCLTTSEVYSGWLKKLGGKFKTWRKRFFVLRGKKLSYYTGPDELRLLGEFNLDSTQVEPLSAEGESNGDVKGYLFVIKPEDPTVFLTSTHQQFILSATTPEERKSWIRAIRKVLYLKKGGALFGTHLSEAFPFTRPEYGYHPRVVHDTTQFIREYGMDTEGIFRKCGTLHALQDLAEAYDVATPGPILNPDKHNVHLVAGLLKFYLRELPEPVIPFRFYDRLKSTGFRMADGQDLVPLINILESLPAPNYQLLQYLCQFLHEVAQHEQTNRMSIENLASVFAPNFLRQADGDLDVEMAVSSILNLTVTEFIRQHDRLFRLELVPLHRLRAPISPKASSRRSRSRGRHTFSSSDGFMAVNRIRATGDNFLVDGLIRKSTTPSVDETNESHSSDYENHPYPWGNRNGISDPTDHISQPLIRNPTYATPQSDDLLPLTTQSDHSSLKRTAEVATSDYDVEDGYCTPTTMTLSSELINSTGSLRLSSREKQMQSSGFISCFDCPTRSLSIGRRSPASSSKLNGSDRTDHRSNFPAVPTHGQRDRLHRATSCNGYSTLSNKDFTSSHRTTPHEYIRRDPDAIEVETPPKPPPFSLTSTDAQLPGGFSSTSPVCHQPSLTRSGTLTSSQGDYAANLLWPSQSAHTFANPQYVRPDDQIRYWRNLAISSRADAAGQRARVRALVGELNRVHCDLNMAELEIGLLRQRLAETETELRHSRRFGLIPAPTQSAWAETWNSR